jgi:hypothetical protein
MDGTDFAFKRRMRQSYARGINFGCLHFNKKISTSIDRDATVILLNTGYDLKGLFSVGSNTLKLGMISHRYTLSKDIGYTSEVYC